MIYKSQFNDIDNVHTYTVNIKTPKNGSTLQDIMLMFDTPVIITYADEADIFEPLKLYSASVSILSKDYLFDLYNENYQVTCKITDEDNNIIFNGYATPNIYSSDYANYSNIVLECISPIAMLKYKDYTTIGNAKNNVKLIDLIQHCIKQTMIEDQEIYFPNIFGFNNNLSQYILEDLYIDEHNFFDDDEQETPWKCYDVLNEICKFLNVSLVEYNGAIYFINYRDIVGNYGYFYTKYEIHKNDDNYVRTANQTKESFYVINANSFRSSDNSINLSETYKKIIVKVNTYPYDSIFTDLMDTKTWNLWPSYTEQWLRLFATIPQLTHSTSNSDNGYYNYFWFYFYSEQFNPYRWSHDPDNTSSPLTLDGSGYDPTTGGWITALNSSSAEEFGYSRNYVGCGLMQTANYEVTDPTLVSSLSWAKTIVFYTGVGNIPLLSSDTTATLKTKAANYLSWCRNSVNDVTNMQMLEIESDADILVSSDSYLVLGGKMQYSVTDFDDPSIKEFTGKSKNEKKEFQTGYAYALIDDYSKDANKGLRTYWGFPMLNIQIEIGTKILVEYRGIEQGDGYTPKIYLWETKGSSHNLQEYGGYQLSGGSTIIELPAGTNQFGFFKYYDITNTCDWRLGINNGKGFAIPLPANSGLSGKLKIRFINLNEDLFARKYIEDINNIKSYIPWGYDSTILVKKPDNSGHILNYHYEFEKVYKGYFPNYLLLQDFSAKIYEVSFTSAFDSTQKVDNKSSDHTYENIISSGAIEDYDEIEVKINTQIEDKNRSFSSVLYSTSNGFDFVRNMTVDTGAHYKIQENNIIDSYVQHYQKPRVMFDCDLDSKVLPDMIPITLFKTMMTSNYLIMNGGEWGLHENSFKAKLVEF